MMTALCTLFGNGNKSSPDIPIRTQRVTEALNTDRRRAVLIELDEGDTPINHSELAERIAAAESDCHRDKLSAGERKRVYIALYQTHLPRLHDLGAVAWNKDSREVSMTNATEPMAELVREIEKRTISG
jgi:hypothetical protein